MKKLASHCKKENKFKHDCKLQLEEGKLHESKNKKK